MPGPPIHRDDQGKSPRAPGLDPGDRVLENGRTIRCRSQKLRRSQKCVRRRLAGQAVIGRVDAVDKGVELVLQGSRLDDAAAVAGRRDDRRAQSGGTRRADQGDAARIDLDTGAPQRSVEQSVLAVAEAAYRLGGRPILGPAVRQLDACLLYTSPSPRDS